MDHEASQSYYDQRYVSTCGSGLNSTECKGMDHNNDRTLVGMIDEANSPSYSKWLKENYKLDIEIKIDPKTLKPTGKPKAWNEP